MDYFSSFLSNFSRQGCSGGRVGALELNLGDVRGVSVEIRRCLLIVGVWFLGWMWVVVRELFWFVGGC